MNCATCVFSWPCFSDEPSEGPILKCHRYPPQMFVLDGEVTQAFPDADDPCGEWQGALT